MLNHLKIEFKFDKIAIHKSIQLSYWLNCYKSNLSLHKPCSVIKMIKIFLPQNI